MTPAPVPATSPLRDRGVNCDAVPPRPAPFVKCAMCLQTPIRAHYRISALTLRAYRAIGGEDVILCPHCLRRMKEFDPLEYAVEYEKRKR